MVLLNRYLYCRRIIGRLAFNRMENDSSFINGSNGETSGFTNLTGFMETRLPMTKVMNPGRFGILMANGLFLIPTGMEDAD